VQKLTIIVNCTDRKSVVPATDLRIRSLPVGDTNERFVSWSRRVVRSSGHIELADLYQGESWLQAKALADEARARGTTTRMFVASAGLGLRNVTQRGPAYAATFARGHADSVTDDVKRLGDWWQRLGDLPDTTSLNRLTKDPVLLVLSESYARAMDADLVKLSECGGNYLLVGGWRTIEGLPRLAADRDLRQVLGGTVSSLSLRMARRWMTRLSGSGLFSTTDAARWSRWARDARRSETYQRAPMPDDELSALIRDLMRDQSDLSATRALRIIRERGFACEQKRFGALFREVSGGQ
jgi:hypothetical protein